MPVKPIDLQTNIAQMHEVARTEQGKSVSIVEGQHVLEKDASEKSKLVNERVDENKKAERTAIRREEESKKKNKNREKYWARRDDKEAGRYDNDVLKDDKLGIIIDVKK